MSVMRDIPAFRSLLEGIDRNIARDKGFIRDTMFHACGNPALAVDNLRVFVVGRERDVENFFFNKGAHLVSAPQNADIVVFTGGQDVDPSLYGEKIHPKTYSDLARDQYEVLMYKLARNKLKVGICRGAQFLCVMNGGKLWQDVDNHALMKGHNMIYRDKTGTNVLVTVSSTHHQMMRPPLYHGRKPARWERWGWAGVSKRKESPGRADREKDNGEVVTTYVDHTDDNEIIFFPDTLSLCFQPHPEYIAQYNWATREVFFDCINRAKEKVVPSLFSTRGDE